MMRVVCRTRSHMSFFFQTTLFAFHLKLLFLWKLIFRRTQTQTPMCRNIPSNTNTKTHVSKYSVEHWHKVVCRIFPKCYIVIFINTKIPLKSYQHVTSLFLIDTNIVLNVHNRTYVSKYFNKLPCWHYMSHLLRLHEKNHESITNVTCKKTPMYLLYTVKRRNTNICFLFKSVHVQLKNYDT